MQDFHPQNLRYARVVERYSRYIESPVFGLKFLKNALKDDQPNSLWKRIPYLGTLPDRAMIIVELARVLPIDQPAPLGIRLTALLYRIRYALYAMCVALALFAGASLVYAVSKIASSLSVSTEARDLTSSGQSGAAASNGSDAVAAIGSGGAGLT